MKKSAKFRGKGFHLTTDYNMGVFSAVPRISHGDFCFGKVKMESVSECVYEIISKSHSLFTSPLQPQARALKTSQQSTAEINAGEQGIVPIRKNCGEQQHDTQTR